VVHAEIQTTKHNFMNKDSKLSELEDRLVELAIQIADSFGKKLDFSEKSVKVVEKILSKFHKEYKKTGDEEGLNGIALEFAFYIIKVIENNYEKGRLERNHKDFGDDSFPYYWRGSTIFPYSWCLKRIFDGKADNVWIKYKVLIQTNNNK